MVGEGDFARAGNGAATEQAHVGNGVVGTAKGPDAPRPFPR